MSRLLKGCRIWILIVASIMLTAVICGCKSVDHDAPRANVESSNIAASLALVPGSVQDYSPGIADPFRPSTNKLVVLIFVSVDCPVANRYAPEISRINAEYSPRGAAFWLVHANTDETAESIRKHSEDYRLNIPAVRDPQRMLVRKANASVTPEAAVFLPGGKLVYHGRIDDRFPALGKDRVEPTRRNLREVLDAVLAGHPSPYKSLPAIGCSIPDR